MFSSYRAVFKLAQCLPDSKTSELNCSYEALVQKEALTICHDRVFASFLCVLSLSSILGRFRQLYHPDNGKTKNNKGMKGRKTGQVNFKLSIIIQGVNKQK